MTGASKSELAYRHLRARIGDGTFVPGYRLVLDALARELDMSPVPVREAIRRLEAEGLVTFERNVGAQVALLDEVEYLHTMETLALVEGAATAQSAALLTPEAIARARALNERLRRSLADFDPQAFTEANREFHASLYGACPNPHLLDLVGRGWQRLAALRATAFGFVPGRAAESVREHDGLLDLIESGGSALEIELAARRHRLATLDAVLAAQSHRVRPEPGAATPVPRSLT